MRYGCPSKLDPILYSLHKRGVCVDLKVLQREKERLNTIGFKSENEFSYSESVFKAYNKSVVYPKYNVLGTKTGRWTTSSPNIQGFPKNKLRRAIVPLTSAHYMVSMDIISAEFMLFLYMIKSVRSKFLIQAYFDGDDIFNKLAIQTGGHRSVVKQMVYQILYSGGLSKMIDKEFLFQFCDFIGVKAKEINFNNLVQLKTGCVKTWTGRYIACNQDRLKLNYQLQGSVVDFINEFCYRIYDSKYVPYIVVHDCVVFSIPRFISAPEHWISKVFSDVVSFLRVEIKNGENWYDVS